MKDDVPTRQKSQIQLPDDLLTTIGVAVTKVYIESFNIEVMLHKV